MKKRFTEDGMDASRFFGMIQAFNSLEEAAMLAVIGLDIAKRFFQLHSVDPYASGNPRSLTKAEIARIVKADAVIISIGNGATMWPRMAQLSARLSSGTAAARRADRRDAG